MKSTQNFTKQEFELALKQFGKNTKCHIHIFPGACTLRISHGCLFVKLEADAGWLFDSIAYYQFHKLIHPLHFQIWKLYKETDKWILECLPDKEWLLENKLSRTSILSTEIADKYFPVDDFEIWVIDRIAMLPSEYTGLPVKTETAY